MRLCVGVQVELNQDSLYRGINFKKTLSALDFNGQMRKVSEKLFN